MPLPVGAMAPRPTGVLTGVALPYKISSSFAPAHSTACLSCRRARLAQRARLVPQACRPESCVRSAWACTRAALSLGSRVRRRDVQRCTGAAVHRPAEPCSAAQRSSTVQLSAHKAMLRAVVLQSCRFIALQCLHVQCCNVAYSDRSELSIDGQSHPLRSGGTYGPPSTHSLRG